MTLIINKLIISQKMKNLKKFIPVMAIALMASCSGKDKVESAESAEETQETTATQPAVEEVVEESMTVVDVPETEPQEASEEAAPADDSQVSDLLSEYSGLAEQLIEAAKKAKDGDMSALPKIPGLQSKCQALAKKLEKLQDKMTPEQMAELAKITSKIAGADY